jgi:hypothetical protein
MVAMPLSHPRNVSRRLFKKYAPGKREKEICASPLVKSEIAGLGAYYDARNEKLRHLTVP